MASSHVWKGIWTLARRPELGPAGPLLAPTTIVLVLSFTSGPEAMVQNPWVARLEWTEAEAELRESAEVHSLLGTSHLPVAGLETCDSHTAVLPSPAESSRLNCVCIVIATALMESTPYLSPGAARPWCQHLASSVILLGTGSFTRSGSQACKARLGPGPSQPGIVPSMGKPQLLGCLCHTLCLPLLLSQPWNQAYRKHQQPGSTISAGLMSTSVIQRSKWNQSLQAKAQPEPRGSFYLGEAEAQRNTEDC